MNNIHTPTSSQPNVQLPKMSDERLEELLSAIRPVVRLELVKTQARVSDNGPVTFRSDWVVCQDNSGDLYYIETQDFHRPGFNWDPRPVGLADDLLELDTIITLHRWASNEPDGICIVAPTIAEVIAQIPEELASFVDAFETGGLERLDEKSTSGFYAAETTFYMRG